MENNEVKNNNMGYLQRKNRREFKIHLFILVLFLIVSLFLILKGGTTAEGNMVTVDITMEMNDGDIMMFIMGDENVYMRMSVYENLGDKKIYTKEGYVNSLPFPLIIENEQYGAGK